MSPKISTTTTLPAPLLAVTLLLLVAVGVGGLAPNARADSYRSGASERADEASRADDGPSAAEVWESKQKWSYNTDYLLPLIRHRKQADAQAAWPWLLLTPIYNALHVPKPVQEAPLYGLAAVYDVAHLPIGAIAGLFGD